MAGSSTPENDGRKPAFKDLEKAGFVGLCLHRV